MIFKGLYALAVALVALVAFTASAYATTVTSSTGTVSTAEHLAESEGHIVMDNPIASIGCASTVSGPIESHGAGVTASGKVSFLSFTNCTNSWHVTVVSAGSLIAHYVSGYNATITSTGATIEATRFGVSCRYATFETDFGLATGGNPTTLDITAAMPFHSGSGLCGSGATTVTGSYVGTGAAYYDA